MTVGQLLALHAEEKEAENKPGTQTNHSTTTNDLVGCFGADADPRKLTPADGKRFLDHLRGREPAGATVVRRLVRRAGLSPWPRNFHTPTRQLRDGPTRRVPDDGGSRVARAFPCGHAEALRPGSRRFIRAGGRGGRRTIRRRFRRGPRRTGKDRSGQDRRKCLRGKPPVRSCPLQGCQDLTA